MLKFSNLISGEDPVLVDFYADWCSPCKTMAPILQEVKSDLGGKVRIIKVNVDKNPKVAQKFDVQSIPTLILFKEGKPKWRRSGVIPKNAIIQVLEQN